MGLLAALFLVTAALYASVGFGGGSTYNALLVLSGTDYRILPAIALVCNIVVVAGGTVRFARAGLVPWRRVLPLTLVSAPLAWAGGLTPIPEGLFVGLLGATLLVAGLLLLFQRDAAPHDAGEPRKMRPAEPLIGGALGYLSGLVGIGGGIFLAPLLHLMRWSGAREIAATASFFILINSIAGLVGQLTKLGDAGLAAQALGYWPLALAVLIGGQLGTHAGLTLFAPAVVRGMTALLVLYVAARLLWQVAS